MRNDFESNYLQHWGLKKGAKKDDHKYFARLGETGKYIYFYTREAYEKYIKGTKEEAQKKVSEATRKMQDAITKGYKTLERKLNKEKDKQIKNDLSTENVRNEKRNVQKEKANANKRKELSTISAKEKASEKAVARKAEVEAKRKAHLNELKQKGIDKKRQEKQQLEAIKKKQQERVNKASKEKMEKAVKERNEQKENWLYEFRKKAKDLFCKDAKDSAKEFHMEHPQIPIKKTVLSKDQDMAAINRGKRFYEEQLRRNFNYGERDNQDYTTLAKEAHEYNVNCASCTIAYDLRRRGYDVTAPKQSSNGFTINEMLVCYKTKDGKDPDTFITSSGTLAIMYRDESYGMKTINANQGGKHSEEAENQKIRKNSGYYAFEESQIKYIKEDILKHNPEGSYGILATNWQGGGGHAMTWSIEDGEVVIRDSQVNEKTTIDEPLSRAISCDYVRTDNLQLTDKAYEYAEAEVLDEAKIVKMRKRK